MVRGEAGGPAGPEDEGLSVPLRSVDLKQSRTGSLGKALSRA